MSDLHPGRGRMEGETPFDHAVVFCGAQEIMRSFNHSTLVVLSVCSGGVWGRVGRSMMVVTFSVFAIIDLQ